MNFWGAHWQRALTIFVFGMGIGFVLPHAETKRADRITATTDPWVRLTPR